MQLTQDVTWRTHPRISLKDLREKPNRESKQNYQVKNALKSLQFTWLRLYFSSAMHKTISFQMSNEKMKNIITFMGNFENT